MSNSLQPTDFKVPGILQARILEWVAIPFSRGSPQPGDRTQVSRVAGRFFPSWTTGKEERKYSEAQKNLSVYQTMLAPQELGDGCEQGLRGEEAQKIVSAIFQLCVNAFTTAQPQGPQNSCDQWPLSS